MIDHKKSLNYYKSKQKEFVQKYNGKTLILREEELLDVKDSIKEAYDFAVDKYGIGNFSLQEVAPGPDSYTAYIATPGVLV